VKLIRVIVALRQLDGENGKRLRRYVLSLALLAGAEPQDGFLRQGCLLTMNPEAPAQWNSVARSGTRTSLLIDPAVLKAYAEKAAEAFGVGKNRRVKFDPELAKADLSEGDAKKGKKGQQKSAAQSAPAT